MDEAKLYWTIIVAVVSAGWVVTAFVRDRISQSVERTSVIVNRLLDGDKLLIDNPDIQKYLSQNAARKEDYFRRHEALEDELFYKAKAYVYRQLNMFDEILSISARTGRGWSLLKPPALTELSDWETYIKVKLGHPLCRSILNNEQHIFGVSLRGFWDANRDKIQSTPVDPFIW
ncbi:hypothetical protein [Geobacter sp.]|uniref:hypothetical protein n=1 Tax=Geobacter sp. TaxID=46610 RepID=UPI0026182F20|nr:hypothetical protein [Geobacter sp.]